MNDKFKVVDENGKEKEAEVVTAFSYKEKEYVIYSTKEADDNYNVYVSRLEKDNNGYDNIIDIEDDKEREEIHNITNEILLSIKKNIK